MGVLGDGCRVGVLGDGCRVTDARGRSGHTPNGDVYMYTMHDCAWICC